jgi:hypothetical protein
MVHLFKLEFKKLKYPYIFSLVLALLCSGLLIMPVQSGYMYDYNIEVWEQSGELFTFFFPLLAVIPTCWLMYYERKNGFLTYTVTRISKKDYIIVKWLAASLGGAFIVFLVSFVGLLISLYLIPDVKASGANTATQVFGSYYFINNPLLYGFILSCWRFVLGFLIASLGFVISLFVKNIFIVLTGPFVYSVLENFTLATLGFPYFRLVTSFYPSTLSQSAITIERLLIGPVILIGFICILIFYFRFIKKSSIYDV